MSLQDGYRTTVGERGLIISGRELATAGNRASTVEGPTDIVFR